MGARVDLWRPNNGLLNHSAAAAVMFLTYTDYVLQSKVSGHRAPPSMLDVSHSYSAYPRLNMHTSTTLLPPLMITCSEVFGQLHPHLSQQELLDSKVTPQYGIEQLNSHRHLSKTAPVTKRMR